MPKPRKKSGPRPGGRPHMLVNMKPGERVYLEAPLGRLNQFMVQVAADITRNDLKGKVTQTFILGIEPTTRIVHELVMLTRTESET